MQKIDEYIPIVGQSVIDELRIVGDKLSGKVIQNVNSTAVGGGVAEILNRMVPLLRELKVDARWDVIKGGEDFFNVTKKFHNLLHGEKGELTQKDIDVFNAAGEANIKGMETYGDIVFIHDPQPIMLVNKKVSNKWVWRCHIDISKPNKNVWEYLKQYVLKYDSVVFSSPAFSQKLPVKQFLISPSIDPLSDKNKELSQDIVDSVLGRFGIDKERPIITQISRFDRLKDPLGVIEVYKQVKKYNDCQLVLAGGGATDDPEGVKVLYDVQEAGKNDPDIHILLLPQDDILINALQRASTIILQKSIREGFGLTVSEALWKSKPVVASCVGGIPLQITHKYSGLLSNSVEGTSFAVKQLLNSPEYAKRLGENGHEHVKNNFLVTRHLKDYMLLFLSLFYDKDLIYL